MLELDQILSRRHSHAFNDEIGGCVCTLVRMYDAAMSTMSRPDFGGLMLALCDGIFYGADTLRLRVDNGGMEWIRDGSPVTVKMPDLCRRYDVSVVSRYLRENLVMQRLWKAVNAEATGLASTAEFRVVIPQEVRNGIDAYLRVFPQWDEPASAHELYLHLCRALGWPVIYSTGSAGGDACIGGD